MKISAAKGMRDIPTIQGLRNRSVPSNREQIVSELARLEHEKARLEREISIWVSNQKKTESRLKQAQDRIDLLQKIMDETDPRRKPEENVSEPGKWQEFPMEY
jgi:predicted  nucleic acid-binding Zn-ribbon protein